MEVGMIPDEGPNRIGEWDQVTLKHGSMGAWELRRSGHRSTSAREHRTLRVWKGSEDDRMER